MPSKGLGILCASCLSLAVAGDFAAASDDARLGAPGEDRRFLTVSDLTGASGRAPDALHYGHFMPVGDHGPAKHEVSGLIAVPSLPVSDAEGRGLRNAGAAALPGFSVAFFSHEGILVPAEQGLIRDPTTAPWDIVLSPGRVWSEPGDGAWSRASFPFTLVNQTWGASRNGVASFLFDDERISALRLQVAQEAAPNIALDLWAQVAATYEPGPVAMRDRLWQALMARRAARVPIRPWSELEAAQGADLLEAFDGDSIRPHVTVSGLLLDGSFYLRPCRTRLGPYPYCAEMRHAVYSQTKTLGALIAMLRLAEKYGPAVWDERILDHVPLDVGHDGWDKVTFRHALNMTTGVGDIVPRRVQDYVDTDATPLTMQTGRAATVVDKLAVIAGFENYPWEPGEVFRYRSVDTFILSLAMDRFLKQREGPEARLWDMMALEVFQPLALGPLPVVETREPRPERRVPLLGYGLLPTLDQVLRLTRLLQNGGAWNGQQILHAGLTAEAIDHSRHLGHPTGWRYKEGGEAHYHLSFWRTPHRAQGGCTVSLPIMAGYGGNYLILLPGDGIALRLADGDDNAPGTWDSYPMRRIADRIKSFC